MPVLVVIVRFVHVVETRGNVFELWRQQKATGHPFEITDVRMERHFNTIEMVQDFFEHMMAEMRGGEVFIPDVPREKVIDRFHKIYGKGAPYKEIGIRRNERLYDPLYTEEEAPFVETKKGYFLIDYKKIRRSFTGTYQE